MFKCQVTLKMSKPGDKAHKIVVRSRPKEYKEWRKNEENRLWEEVLVGKGFETVREITATEEGLELWNTWSEDDRNTFLAESR